MRMIMACTLAAATLSAIACAAPASAATEKFKADLSADKEVPPHAGLKGHGVVDGMVDTATRKMTWHLSYEGLTGAATMAHFHGPAPAGKNAGVQVPATTPVATNMEGSATLTPDQLKMFEDCELYFNVHTAANPGGEIRGQVVKE